MQVLNEIPTKRLQVYDNLGLSRFEGSELSKILGFEKREALTSQEIEALARLTNVYHQWKAKGHSIKVFCQNYRG